MSRRDPEPLLSVYENDPEMGEIVALFVLEMPQRREELLRAQRAGDLESAIRIAHQLKGSAGGYGFEELGIFAAEAERALLTLREAPHASGQSLRLATAPLLEACDRVRLALPQSAA